MICFLCRYVPPLTSTARLPENVDDIKKELRKQESLLSQIHAEMHAGSVCKKREEQLWEGQRIVTQLKVDIFIYLYTSENIFYKSKIFINISAQTKICAKIF